MVLFIGSGGLGGRDVIANDGVYSEATGYHCRVYCKSPNL